MIRIRGGDRSAFAILLDRYWAALVRYAAGRLGGEDDAEDVVQDVFIRVWRFRSDWSATGSVSAYLYRITRNLTLNAGRDERAETRRRERAGEAGLDPAYPSTPSQELDLARLQAHVDAAIAALPSRRREVFVLSRFHGLSHREIAQAMDISPQTVANQMTAALEQLREALSSHLDRG